MGWASPNLDLGRVRCEEPDSVIQAVSMSLTWNVLSRWCPTLATVFGHQISHGDLSVVAAAVPTTGPPQLLRATSPEPRRSHGPGLLWLLAKHQSGCQHVSHLTPHPGKQQALPSGSNRLQHRHPISYQRLLQQTINARVALQSRFQLGSLPNLPKMAGLTSLSGLAWLHSSGFCHSSPPASPPAHQTLLWEEGVAPSLHANSV